MKKSTEFPSVVIKAITFNAGKPIEFNKDDIVLLVGANNVGKSRALKDLREDLNNTSKSKVIIKNVAYEATGFSGDKLRDYVERNIAKSSYGGYNVWVDDNTPYTFDEHSFTNISDEKDYYKAMFSFLSTENRLGLTRPINFRLGVDNQSLNIVQKLEKYYDSITNLNKALDLGFQNSVEVYEDYVDGH